MSISRSTGRPSPGFRRLLDPDEANGDPAEMSGFLRGLRIYTGAALSLALSGADDDVDFDPVLFDADTARKAADDGRPLAESDGMLPGEILRTFQQTRTDGLPGVRRPPSAAICSAQTPASSSMTTSKPPFRWCVRSNGPDRRSAGLSLPIPGRRLPERLAGKARMRDGEARQEDEDTREEETEGGDPVRRDARVCRSRIGIGIWEKPNLDFLPHTPNVWLPEIFAIEFDGVWVRLDEEAVAELRKAVDAAIEAGAPGVNFRGQRIPATDEVRDKLAGIVGIEKPGSSSDDDTSGDGDGDDDGKEPPRPTVVVVHENFVEENWSPLHEPREALVPMKAPRAVATKLLGHQRKALEWQIEAWRAGHPGVLNADDQGLGKTLQTLAFVAWLQDHMAEGPPGTAGRPWSSPDRITPYLGSRRTDTFGRDRTRCTYRRLWLRASGASDTGSRREGYG